MYGYVYLTTNIITGNVYVGKKTSSTYVPTYLGSGVLIKEAVDIASNITKKDHICLMSPAAASYNQFKSFEEKGNYYKECIKDKFKSR
jgi:UDP-N-acetylmuramoylalanine-D-glutamate ligase